MLIKEPIILQSSITFNSISLPSFPSSNRLVILIPLELYQFFIMLLAMIWKRIYIVYYLRLFFVLVLLRMYVNDDNDNDDNDDNNGNDDDHDAK